MTDHVIEELPEWALGILSPEESARVESHLSRCASCTAESRALLEASSAVALSLPHPQPSPQIFHRLLAAVESKGRLARYTDALAKFFEITGEKARSLIDAIDEPRAWLQDPSGIGLIHLAAGPRFAGADAGLVRFPAGMEWPLHRHVGPEHHLFLEGGIREDQTGLEFRAGDELIKDPSTEHSFHVLPERDCVVAVIIFGGIEMPPGTPVQF
ncbi:MAG: cupin domain-containing protein [Polyangiales bacterium]